LLQSDVIGHCSIVRTKPKPLPSLTNHPFNPPYMQLSRLTGLSTKSML
jgi:hypothetical protein